MFAFRIFHVLVPMWRSNFSDETVEVPWWSSMLTNKEWRMGPCWSHEHIFRAKQVTR
jgi:hypothetical protein